MIPDDYEECGECGFDHGYDYPEAFKAHKALEYQGKEKANQEACQLIEQGKSNVSVEFAKDCSGIMLYWVDWDNG